MIDVNRGPYSSCTYRRLVREKGGSGPEGARQSAARLISRAGHGVAAASYAVADSVVSVASTAVSGTVSVAGEYLLSRKSIADKSLDNELAFGMTGEDFVTWCW